MFKKSTILQIALILSAIVVIIGFFNLPKDVTVDKKKQSGKVDGNTTDQGSIKRRPFTEKEKQRRDSLKKAFDEARSDSLKTQAENNLIVFYLERLMVDSVAYFHENLAQ